MAIGNPTRELIPVGTLTIDPGIRPDVDPDSPAVSTLCNHYDRGKLGVFVVSRRPDGTVVVIDGYARRHAVLRCADADTRVECVVHTGLTVAQEIELSRSINGMPDDDVRDDEGDAGPETPASEHSECVVVSEDCDTTGESYSLCRLVRTHAGAIVRIDVRRLNNDVMGSRAAAGVRVGDDWLALFDYPALHWAPSTPRLPSKATGMQTTETTNPWTGAETIRFVRRVLTVAADEVQRRAFAILATRERARLVVQEAPHQVVATYDTVDQAQAVADSVNAAVGYPTVATEYQVPHNPDPTTLLARMRQFAPYSASRIAVEDGRLVHRTDQQ